MAPPRKMGVKDNPNALAGYLRKVLDDLGWKAVDLARAMGWSEDEGGDGPHPSTISRILNGQVAVPELATLDQLADALNRPTGGRVTLPGLIEVAGYRLEGGPPHEAALQTIARLTEEDPDMLRILQEIARVNPDDMPGLIAYLAALRNVRLEQYRIRRQLKSPKGMAGTQVDVALKGVEQAVDLNGKNSR